MTDAETLGSQAKPLIVIGADHGGFEQKQLLVSWLSEQGYQISDCGAFVLDESDDYPQFAQAVARAVTKVQADGLSAVGILVCRSGAGMVIAANRYKGVRAVGVFSPEQAVHARAHNDANIIVLSGDWMNLDDMQSYIQTFLQTPFSGESRHQRRLAQIEQITQIEQIEQTNPQL